MGYDEVWAAAGTPRSVFPLTPAELAERSGGTRRRRQSSQLTTSATGARSGTGCSWRRGPRCSRPIRCTSSGTPSAARPAGPAQHRGRAPVAREPALLGAQQHDERGDAGGQHVLLVADRSSPPSAAPTAIERRRAVELGGGLGRPPPAFSRASAWAQDAEAPRVRQVVVGRPARELEQLLERLAVQRLRRRRPCRSPGADASRLTQARHRPRTATRARARGRATSKSLTSRCRRGSRRARAA